MQQRKALPWRFRHLHGRTEGRSPGAVCPWACWPVAKALDGSKRRMVCGEQTAIHPSGRWETKRVIIVNRHSQQGLRCSADIVRPTMEESYRLTGRFTDGLHAPSCKPLLFACALHGLHARQVGWRRKQAGMNPIPAHFGPSIHPSPPHPFRPSAQSIDSGTASN